MHLKTKITSEDLKRPNTKLRKVFTSFTSSNYKMCATVITSRSKLLNSFHEEQYMMEMIWCHPPSPFLIKFLFWQETQWRSSQLISGATGWRTPGSGSKLILLLLMPLNLAISMGGKLLRITKKLQALVTWEPEKNSN